MKFCNEKNFFAVGFFAILDFNVLSSFLKHHFTQLYFFEGRPFDCLIVIWTTHAKLKRTLLQNKEKEEAIGKKRIKS